MRTPFTKPVFYSGALLAVIFSFFYGCKKEEITEPDYNKLHLIKTEIIESVENGTPVQHTFNYQYTENNMIQKVIKNSEQFDYQYDESGKISIIHSNGNGSSDTTVLELNSQGMVNSKDELAHKRITRYKYDSEGHCISYIYSTYGADTSDIVQEIERANFTYIDGDLITENRVYNNNELGFIQNYYYKDRVNVLCNASKGMSFFGKSSKHLLKPGNATDEFDAEGRLIKRIYPNVTYIYGY